MSHIPKSIDTLNKALATLVPQLVKQHGATNVQIVSPRTMRFDLPDGKAKDGINRVKITARGDGTLDVRFIQMIEHELVGGVHTDSLATCLQNFTGLELS